MKLTVNKIFLSLILLFAALNISLFFNFQFLFIREVLVFIGVLFIPGILINLILKINTINKLEYMLYTIGVSLTFIMISGLFISWLLPFFHISNPLSTFYIIASFNTAFFILFPLAYIRNKRLHLIINLPTFSLKRGAFYITPFTFPLLSIFGAISLNNEGTNIFTSIMLGASAAYIMLITKFKKKISNFIYPLTLFLISLSVLLMLSLRSWYIAGFDVSIEYEVFKITQQYMHWAMSNFKNEYNTCLSITILPTYLSSLLHINDVYIYKFFYQILFAISPVGIYLLAKKLDMSSMVAFLSGLFYICNPWFIDPMTTLNRQEIAFFFFILVLLLLFEKSLDSFKKYTLLSILTIGLVVSHYSSTYITIILFSFVYVIGLSINILKKFWLKKSKIKFDQNIKLPYLVFLISITFIWYSLLNASTTNLTDVAKSTYKNLPHIFSQNARTSIIDQLFNAGKTNISSNAYQDYYSVTSSEYKNKKIYDTYSHNLYNNYHITPMSSPSLPIHQNFLYTIISYIYKFLLVFIELSLFVGSIYLVIFKKKQRVDINFTILLIVCELLLALMTILPYISVGYNFDRLYMQVMFILSVVEIFGGVILINLFIRNKEASTKLLSYFYIIVFLFTYCFIWQIVGGKTVMWLNNFGYYYDQTYTHGSEYLTANWLKQIPGNPRIYTTDTGRNILAAYAHKNNVKTDLFPSTIETYAYVFVTYTNLKEGIASFYYRGAHLEYAYPLNFIKQNKNLIYSNGKSEVYK